MPGSSNGLIGQPNKIKSIPYKVEVQLAVEITLAEMHPPFASFGTAKEGSIQVVKTWDEYGAVLLFTPLADLLSHVLFCAPLSFPLPLLSPPLPAVKPARFSSPQGHSSGSILRVLFFAKESSFGTN